MMYMDHKKWDDAERIAESSNDESLMQEVLHAQAADEFRQKNFEKFEALNLRARKPDAIVALYKEAGMWMEALRVCTDYMPAKLSALQAEYDKTVGTRNTRDVGVLLNEARQWENNGQYLTAVKCYLKVNQNNCPDNNTIVKALSEAARITNNYLDGVEALGVVKLLGPKLIEMRQHNMAAQLFMSVDLIKEALDTLIANEDWQRAMKIVKEIEPSYESYVESRYKDSLRSQGRAEQLADVDIISALDLLCEQGQWTKALDMARSHGPNVLNKYIALYAAHLIKTGYSARALDLYIQHGAPALPQNYNIYRTIAADVMSVHRSNETYKNWSKLRDMFYQLTEAMNSTSDSNTPTQTEFETLMLVGHYYALRFAAKNISSLEKIVAKISISLLRYSDVIPADKAYFEAGMDARVVGLNTDAFLFLNHCLDILEAMEEGSDVSVDHSDLLSTDFPQQIPLPEKPYLHPNEIEAVKEWVLSVSMDRSVDVNLAVDDRGVYPASLTGLSGPPAAPCLVTGFPVLQKRIRFKRGMANTDDWSALQMALRMHPTDSNLADVMSFIHKWAGSISDPAAI
uniref:Intraflagellar transport protein 172 n=2 Tax=Lygus hesperus TaxID=30085 RepID=A0A146M0F0_LYGHE